MISKICHDLIGSTNAINFGLQEIITNGEINTNALELARQSSDILINRLKYFRSAFGYSLVGDSLTLTKNIHSLAQELFKEKEIDIIWPEDYEARLTNYLDYINSKLFLSILFIIFCNVIKVSSISININKAKNTDKVIIIFTVKGVKAVLSNEVKDILMHGDNVNEEIEQSTPQNAHVYFTNILKKEAGSQIDIKYNDAKNLLIAFSLNVASN